MEYKAGQRLYTGHVLTEKDAQILNAANHRVTLECGSEQSLNSRHLTFQEIALSSSRTRQSSHDKRRGRRKPSV